jgi:IrrE N-terminal-like domain
MIRGAAEGAVRHLAPLHLTLSARYGKYESYDYKGTSRGSARELSMSNSGTRRATAGSQRIWSHPSVLGLAGGANPLETITARARATALRAIQSGWSGPPYDPFALAEFLKISVEPCQDVMDARIVPIGGGKFRIEFNPNRSRARINFSVAHEIIHTLFPDCAEAIRNRFTHAEMKSNDWQLEVLCNVGAAEILMPVGSFKFDDTAPISIDTVIALQRKFCVSTEAVLLRTAKLTGHQCFVFAAHRENIDDSHQYRIDYAVSSRGWPLNLAMGFRLPASTVATECTAIGFTAKAEEDWGLNSGAFRVECLGIAPYPGHVYPRVVGIVRPLNEAPDKSLAIRYLRGDATQPRGAGLLNTLLSAKAYRNKPHTVLILETLPLVRRYEPSITLSPMNSGNTLPIAHPRGPDTFKVMNEYPFQERMKRGPYYTVVELAVEGGVPDAADYTLLVQTMVSDGTTSTSIETIYSR